MEIDIEPLRAAARLLYEGAFVAERHTAVGDFVETHPDAVEKTVGSIIAAAGKLAARDLAADTDPEKPGLVRVSDGGESIEGELWELPAAGLGSFLAALPAPMALGRVRLDDGCETTGFLCETIALDGADDITAHGSWPEYLAA